MDAAKRGRSKVPSLPPPRPKSPPEYPDLYGTRRELAKVQMLEREIGFLEEELKSVEQIQPASRPCKEVTDFVVANSDPLVTTNCKIRRSRRFWKWLCGKSCFILSWICCCGCCPHLKIPSCSCNLCNCQPCACCSIPKCQCCSWPPCACCSIPKCQCCSWPCTWPCSSKCCNIFSCSSCCICQCPSCPDCSCSKCTCCCPKFPRVPRCSRSCSCTRCIKDCCYSCCLCY